MKTIPPSPASTSLHQVSTDSIVVVCSSLVVCLLQPSVPPIAIMGVPTFELVYTSCGLTYTSVWDALGPSGITAPPPPPVPPTSTVVAPTPPTQPYIAACDSPGLSELGAWPHL